MDEKIRSRVGEGGAVSGSPLTNASLCNNCSPAQGDTARLAALRFGSGPERPALDADVDPRPHRARRNAAHGRARQRARLGSLALAHNLKPLERDGLVALVPSATDRRSRLATLTSAGRAKLAECRGCGGRRRSISRRSSGADHAAQLRAALGVVASEDFAANFNRLRSSGSAAPASATLR